MWSSCEEKDESGVVLLAPAQRRVRIQEVQRLLSALAATVLHQERELAGGGHEDSFGLRRGLGRGQNPLVLMIPSFGRCGLSASARRVDSMPGHLRC